MFDKISRWKVLLQACILSFSIFSIFSFKSAIALTSDNPEVADIVNRIFTARTRAMLGQNIEFIDSMYNKE